MVIQDVFQFLPFGNQILGQRFNRNEFRFLDAHLGKAVVNGLLDQRANLENVVYKFHRLLFIKVEDVGFVALVDK